ncbi:MAG: hypothetical protein E7624_01450 [Ruminococcaceae bacterium]|nr:hypothetical protein [Oscillospiraceae bacterium]
MTFFLFSLAVFMLFWQMVLLGRYEFLSGKSLPFWLPCLIGAVVVAAIAVIWGRLAKVGIWSGIPLAMIFGVFAFGLLSGMAANMNYVYDTAEPVRYESVIYVKDRDMNHKSPDRYTFDLIVDGKKITLDVSREAYERYEVGDTFSFFKYQGAFQEPFYLAGS